MADFSAERFLEEAIRRGVREEIQRVAEEEAAKAIEAINRRIGASIGHIVLQVSKNYDLHRDGPDLIIRVRDLRADMGQG
ncbi:MAG: hypothetical protein KAY22_23495 [Rhizorhabdus sp.]|uniref:hypothetical protein n=1 Tax=Rhizorhabdus sp. TaxID=1968843 RepID=UPI001B4EDFC4|nr:hypothetical protein [Rhizorhabdus sp.]MBP8235265.1 hypothetical protein [Rhizorhabdus sp.]